MRRQEPTDITLTETTSITGEIRQPPSNDIEPATVVQQPPASVKSLNGEAGLCEKYCDHAEVEDRHLIQKYSDDITGLLTFAGLLSAIITAFLLVEDVDFKVHSTATTNALLYQVLIQQGYPIQTTDGAIGPLSANLFNTTGNDLDTHAILLYHMSLSFSLLSAFGGLASKQWIMHYGYLPPWADDSVRKARLRRMRHQGLKSWGFYIIMGVIPLLIQLSLVLFATGALLASREGSLIRVIIGVSIAVGSVFWASTLLFGTLMPSSPFKSPTSQALFRLIFCVINIHLYAYRFGNRIASTLGFLRRNRILHARWQLLERWSSFRNMLGEESCLVDESIAAGIRWWGLRQDLVWDPTPSLTSKDEELVSLTRRGTNRQKGENRRHELLVKHHARMVKKIVGHDPLLLDWGLKVLERANSPSTDSRSDLKAQIEILCDFIYYVPAAAPFLLDAALCQAIRWTQGVDDSKPLTISDMSETTAAVYFRGLLCAGLRASRKIHDPKYALSEGAVLLEHTPTVEQTRTDDTWIRHGKRRLALCKEINAVLDMYQFNPVTTENEFFYLFVEDITSTIALASILLARDQLEAGSVTERAKLAQLEPHKQLFGAWELLSKVSPYALCNDPDFKPLGNLMLACISASAAILSNLKVQIKFLDFAGLENKHFRACLDTLAEVSKDLRPELGEIHSPFQLKVASLVQRLKAHEHRFSPQLKEQLHNLSQSEHLKADAILDAKLGRDDLNSQAEDHTRDNLINRQLGTAKGSPPPETEGHETPRHSAGGHLGGWHV